MKRNADMRKESRSSWVYGDEERMGEDSWMEREVWEAGRKWEVEEESEEEEEKRREMEEAGGWWWMFVGR